MVCFSLITPPAAARPLPIDAVVVQLFEWPYASVAAECPRLAADGIRFVQISPPQEYARLANPVWYDRYQPVSYKIGGRSGDEAALAALFTACNAAGVDVLVDAVLNHMAILPPENVQRHGVLGSEYWRYSFPGTYAYWDFHRCDHNPPDGMITHWMDRWEVQNCNLSGLADLATETDWVRDSLAGYLRRLTDLGAAGFRIDAAKHVPAADLAEIVRRTARPEPYLLQEVIATAADPIQPSEYTPLGTVTEFSFASELDWRVRDGRLDGLVDALQRLLVPADHAAVFIDNHDTQRGHAGQSALTYKDGTRYALANALMLAWPYGTPVLMSSYRFTDHLQGPPLADGGGSQAVSDTCDTDPDSLWVCEHRWRTTRAMAAWRARVGDAGVDHVTESATEIAFSRGGRGFFALNLATTPVTRHYPTSLPPGLYCDGLAAPRFDGTCPDGSVLEVFDDGTVAVTVPANSAVATDLRRRFRDF